MLLLLIGSGFSPNLARSAQPAAARASSATTTGKASGKSAGPTLVKVTPIPTYQIEALTTAGLGAKGMAGADVMRLLLGGGPSLAPTISRSLELRLESPQVVANPTAEHRVPAALGMGATLPLKSLSTGTGEPSRLVIPEPTMEGQLRMLMFRGCADSAGADQPEIVTLTGLTDEQRRKALLKLQALAATPFSADGSGTSGRWPHEASDTPVPAQGSLVGGHTLVSNYAPEIRFQVTASHDFLAPVALNSEAVGGAQRLSWKVVPGALGYQATATAAGRREGDIVMWTSSEAPGQESWVPDELQAAEAARLAQRKVLLPPERTSCAISAQAMAAMRAGAIVNFSAYGETLLLSSPQGQPAWRLSLERRSTATRPIGAGMEMFNRDPGGAPEPEPPTPKRGFNPFSLF